MRVAFNHSILASMILTLLPAYAYAQSSAAGPEKGSPQEEPVPQDEADQGAANAVAMAARVRMMQKLDPKERVRLLEERDAKGRNKRQGQYTQLAPLPQGDALEGTAACVYKLSNGRTLRTSAPLIGLPPTSTGCGIK